ncbi:kinase-like domain-containing protein [Fennellomyces sp. T-0311]|nr:kinase-like domain-containing protein [Fennellomyces sp. T-0311]
MKTQSKDQLAGQYTSVSVDRSMYYSPALAPIPVASSAIASSSQTDPLKAMAPIADKQSSGSNSFQAKEGENLENRKEAIVLKDEPNKRTPVMVTPDSSSSDLSCLSSIELIENVEFPYTGGSPDLLLQEPRAETPQERKGFRPFVRTNSLSSSSGSVVTVTMSTVLRSKRKGPLQSLTVGLKNTYSNIDPDFGYTGRANPRRVLTRPSKPATNYGYDNEHNDYIIRVGDIVGSEKNKYRIIDLLGSGTFGQVVKCERTSTRELVSVKIIKNKRDYRKQSVFEADIVQELHRKVKPQDHHYLLNIYETFDHANHFCIVSELLSYSLLEVLKQNNYMGLPIHLVRSFSIRIIDTLVLLKEAKFIHCDLKPENILLTSLDSSEIKVVDYGAACHIGKKPFGYIQSRFYRAPEILLGLPYSYSIDMWSAGCVIGELFLGMPLFPGTCEHNQLRRIIDISPPQEMLTNGANTHKFFNHKTVGDRPTIYRMKSQDQYNEEQKKMSVPQRQYFPKMGLTDLILNYPYSTENDKEQELQQRQSLADFLKGLLTVDPDKRWTPNQARGHPFLNGKPCLVPYVPVKDAECNNSNSTKSDSVPNGKDMKPKYRNINHATEKPTQQIQPETNPANVTSATTIVSAALAVEAPTPATLPVALPINPMMSATVLPPMKPVVSTAPAAPLLTKEPSKATVTKSVPSSLEKILGPAKGRVSADNSSTPKDVLSPKPVSIMMNGKDNAWSPLIGDQQNVIIMPAAATGAPLTASDKTVINTSATNSVLERLRMHYKNGGSPSGVLLTSSPAAIAAKKSTSDLSKRIKIAPLIKLRRGSHDSFRTPDEIRLPYTSAAPNNLYQHNNTSRVKLDSYSSVGSHDSSDTSDNITSNRKPAKHAGEAAGGLLMMRGKQTA